MIFHYPDNPVRATPVTLLQLEKSEPGRWIGQLKFDGWRNIVYKEGGKWTRHAKYDTGAQAKASLPESIIRELDALNLPDGTGFDSEWMGMRETARLAGRQYLVLLDLHYWNDQWQGDTPYFQRLNSLKTLLELHKAKAKTATPNIELVPSSELGLLGLFEASKQNPLTEGIVAKARDSRLIGNTRMAVDNKHWVKVKWR